ncbi:hypothetical protein [uncultured Lamprocystis sp.]|uniref:hypothetical protein n=1 Tax=uncultured Lamprocystis sp. TaxID=543132 RepID=UPI0025E91458|nr:hypothetical protein [uncultured Lamprocystis sp.]
MDEPAVETAGEFATAARNAGGVSLVPASSGTDGSRSVGGVSGGAPAAAGFG